VRGVERSLERAEVVPVKAQRSWRARLDEVGLEFGLPGVMVRADVARVREYVRERAPRAH
jgi:hypothetical protein